MSYRYFKVSNGYWIKELGNFPPEDYDVGIFENSTWFSGEFDSPVYLSKESLFKDSIWVNGTFIKGIFDNSTWYIGRWKKGKFINNSIWYNGIWENGQFENSIWKFGKFLDGYFENSTWENGFFIGGDFTNSIWLGGTWQDGYWNSGSWGGGKWIKGWIRDDNKEGNYEDDWTWVNRGIAKYVRSPINPSEYWKRKR